MFTASQTLLDTVFGSEFLTAGAHTEQSNLRSTTVALCQPFMTTTFVKRAFWCSAPAVAGFKSRLKTFLFSQAFSFLCPLTLPGPSASEVTTLWRYMNLFIIIIIIMVGVPEVGDKN